MATILIIGNDELILTLSRPILDKEHRVLGAKTTDEGLKLFRQYSPNLIITDLFLPDSKGSLLNPNDALKLVSTLGCFCISRKKA